MTTPPPTGRRRRFRIPVLLYAHPFEVCIGVAILILGGRALIEGATSPSVDQLPDLPLLLYRVASTLGGLGLITGLLLRQHALGRAVERAGCYVLASALAGYAVLVIAYQGREDGFGVSIITTAIAAGCLLRALAIRKTERIILASLRVANRDPIVLRRLVDGRPPEEPIA